ncbi:alpha/beta fold hydrolase [Methylomonas sp. AM2-LC]|uniref:extracellular catalytic domain type 1 short-chain-length polyhydroxyalkanoate depolymerase n=1 Tax=Methylomonas sp. AM2-LC TaxID=3153301 RepID=UPI003264650F
MLVKAIIIFLLLLVTRPACAAFSEGDYRFELEIGGRTRSYLVHIPPKSGPLPVVINLHGGGGNAQQHRETTGMDAAADHDGYIAVYPNGSGLLSERLLTWNAGNCCAYAQTQGIDDVGFISALLGDLEKRANIDSHRIYAVGHSNGGMMAHRLGEALPERITAIASIAGSHVPTAANGRAIPVLHIHSEDDPRALYYGGLGPPFPLTGTRVFHPSVNAALSEWVRHDGCNSVPTEVAFKSNGTHTARKLVYENCFDGAQVVLWKLTSAGHGWPGGKPILKKLVGPSTNVIDANTEVWAFFLQFQLP